MKGMMGMRGIRLGNQGGNAENQCENAGNQGENVGIGVGMSRGIKIEGNERMYKNIIFYVLV